MRPVTTASSFCHQLNCDQHQYINKNVFLMFLRSFKMRFTGVKFKAVPMFPPLFDPV